MAPNDLPVLHEWKVPLLRQEDGPRSVLRLCGLRVDLMALRYLSVKANPEGRIVAIATKPIGGGSLELLLAWKHEHGERGILTEFVNRNNFWRHRWEFTPTGVALVPQLGHLWRRSMFYGLLPFGKDPWDAKPTMDIQPVLHILNADGKLPDWEVGGLPAMFYGASLERFAGARLAANSVADLVKNGQVAAAEAALREEAETFERLWGTLCDNGPKWWKATLAPQILSSAGGPEIVQAT